MSNVRTLDLAGAIAFPECGLAAIATVIVRGTAVAVRGAAHASSACESTVAAAGVDRAPTLAAR